MCEIDTPTPLVIENYRDPAQLEHERRGQRRFVTAEQQPSIQRCQTKMPLRLTMHIDTVFSGGILSDMSVTEGKLRAVSEEHRIS